MDGLNNKVVCCFCGKSLLLRDAVVLIALPHINSEEEQQFFCHKEHLIENLDKSVILHPDLFDKGKTE